MLCEILQVWVSLHHKISEEENNYNCQKNTLSTMVYLLNRPGFSFSTRLKSSKDLIALHETCGGEQEIHYVND